MIGISGNVLWRKNCGSDSWATCFGFLNFYLHSNFDGNRWKFRKYFTENLKKKSPSPSSSGLLSSPSSSIVVLQSWQHVQCTPHSPRSTHQSAHPSIQSMCAHSLGNCYCQSVLSLPHRHYKGPAPRRQQKGSTRGVSEGGVHKVTHIICHFLKGTHRHTHTHTNSLNVCNS